MRKFVAAAILLSLAAPVAGQKTSGSTPDQQVGYRVLSGKTVKLMLANEDGSNASAVVLAPPLASAST